MKRGFTLIEMVIVIALVAAVSIVIVDLFIGQNRIYNTQTAELNVTSGARIALDEVDSYVRQANRVLGSYATYTASSTVLILQIQSINVSNQLIAATFDNVVFYLNSGSLYRQVFPNAASSRPATTKRLADGVTSLEFLYTNADYNLVTKISTIITVVENSGIQNRSITLSSEASLRSY